MKQRQSEQLWSADKESSIKTNLLSIAGIGNRTYIKLKSVLEKLGRSWQEVWEGELLEKEGQIYNLSLRQVENIKKFKLEWGKGSQLWRENLEQKGVKVILSDDDFYPDLLRELEDGDRPEILFVRGEKGNLKNEIKVAVVGTRRITSYGQMATKKIVSELVRAEKGVTIVSGFMYGVDVMAQREAWIKGGKTIGVLGYGFDHCFPARQKQLMEEMLKEGQTMISEYPPATEPRAGNFPVRNRIVAGMSWGTIVVEAAKNSGSLITADLAAEYGREVFDVPAPISNPYGEGTKELLKAGATLISSGDDVLKELNLMRKREESGIGTTGNLTASHIIEQVLQERGGTIEINQLQQELVWSTEKLQMEILNLCLEDRIERQGECINLL